MTYDRRDFMKTAGAGIAATAAGAVHAGADSKPNVVLIIVDQMRLPRWFPEDLGMPAYQRLVDEGVSFTNYFVSAVPCSASRACLFTGLHLDQHGVSLNVSLPGLAGGPSLDPEIPTIGNHFQDAGYKTPYFGKWHLTAHYDLDDTGLSRYGFDKGKGPDRDGLPLEGLLYDGGVAAQTVNWLEQNHGRGPWMLTCSFINPHDIMWYKRFDVPPVLVPDVCELPGNFNDDLSLKPSNHRRWQQTVAPAMGVGPNSRERVWREFADFYYYLHQKLDRQIAKVLDALDRLGLADDTLVVFTSDHGEMAGAHQLQGKGPFFYQENNNVPLVFRWPKRLAAGAQTRALGQSVDVIHTLLETSGIEADLGGLPGRSLLPALSAPAEAEVNDHVLMAWGDWTPGEDEFNLLNLVTDGPVVPMQGRAIFDGRYKYARYFKEGIDDEFELYDLVNDPLEMDNLAGDPGYRKIEKEMADKLGQAQRDAVAPL